MRYYLARGAALKWLETPFVYQIADDELFELDKDSFQFMKNCSSVEGCISRDGGFIDYCMEEGLLTTETVSTQRPSLRQSPEPSLRYLELQITDACNLRCKHCYINGAAGNELSLKQVRAILADFEEMQGLRLLITGGEPLLHREFDQINEMLPDFAFRKVLFTNGMLLNKEIIKNLNVHEIQVSIDGLESAHNKIRGAGSYKSAIEAVKRSLEAGMAVSVSTMVHRENLSDFDSMERLFKNMGIKDWTVDIPCSAGRLRENPELHVTPEEGAQFLGYGYGGGIHSSTQGYGCGLHLMAVLADGTMAKCAFYKEKTLGTVDDGLRAAWKNAQPVRLKDLSCNCEYLEVCRGGCRYRAELLNGKAGRDLYRCRFYGIL